MERCNNVFSNALTICRSVKEGVMIMWNLGGTLKGVWEESNPAYLIHRNHLDHNTKLTVFLCCFSLAVVGEVFGTRYAPIAGIGRGVDNHSHQSAFSTDKTYRRQRHMLT